MTDSRSRWFPFPAGIWLFVSGDEQAVVPIAATIKQAAPAQVAVEKEHEFGLGGLDPGHRLGLGQDRRRAVVQFDIPTGRADPVRARMNLRQAVPAGTYLTEHTVLTGRFLGEEAELTTDLRHHVYRLGRAQRAWQGTSVASHHV
jgi:hypothetical protein